MKVLLFVQAGDKRPKALPLSPPYHYPSESESDWLVRCRDWCVRRGVGGRAARWWLVECENADEGRRVITGLCHSMDCALLRDDSHEASCDCGRILASGGKP